MKHWRWLLKADAINSACLEPPAESDDNSHKHIESFLTGGPMASHQQYNGLSAMQGAILMNIVDS